MFLIWSNDCHSKVMEGLSMQKCFGNEVTFKIDVLHFVGSNIFSLLKLEDVLLSVDNLEVKTVWKDLPNITCFKPTILSDSIFRCFFHFVIAKEDLRASDPNLSSGRRTSLFILILSSIFHFRNIAKFDFSGFT